MRCRGLLTKSTPPTKATRHHWSFGRSTMRRGVSSCRTPSSGSSLRENGEYILPGDQSSSRASLDANGGDLQGYPFPKPFRARDGPGPGSPTFSPLPPLVTNSSQEIQPFVLSPCISIASESTVPEHGPQAIWAAIEISGRLSRIASSRSPSKSSSKAKSMTGSFIDPQLGWCPCVTRVQKWY